MSDQTPKKKRKSGKVLFVLIFIIALACFAGSAGYLGKYYYVSHKAEKQVDDLRTKMDEDESGAIELADETSEKAEASEELTFNPKFTTLYEENSDIVGWIKIDDTSIDYPVMQTPDDNEFYLHKNFEKEYEYSGLPFVDARCDIKTPSENLVIYGHHMNTDTMFTAVHEYKDQKFYKSHQIIHFDTIYGDADYQICYVILSKAYEEDEDVFKYYDFIQCEDEEAFKEVQSELEKLTIYDTGETVTFEDELITLSTCEYSQTNGRMALIAKKIK